MNVGDVLGFLWCRGEADLRSGGEIFEDFFPGGIIGGATTVTLVDDDQVKKAGREFPEELLAFLRPGDGLIKTKVNFIGCVDAALFVECGREFDLGPVCALDGFRSRAKL